MLPAELLVRHFADRGLAPWVLVFASWVLVFASWVLVFAS